MLSATYLTATLLGLAAAWRQVRVLELQASGLLVVRASLAQDLGVAIESYCAAHLRRSPFGPRSFGTAGDFVRPLGRWATVAFERIGGDTVIFWRDWRPLVLTGIQGANTNGQRDATVVFSADRMNVGIVAYEKTSRRS